MLGGWRAAARRSKGRRSSFGDPLRHIGLFIALTLALPTLAYAAPPADQALVAGDDLTEWLTMEQRGLQGEAAVSAYRTFALTYADSALAEAAWSRLVALGADQLEVVEGTARATLSRVRARWEGHQMALVREPSLRLVVRDLAAPSNDAAAMRDQPES